MSIYQNVDKSAVDIGGLYCNYFDWLKLLMNNLTVQVVLENC